MTGVQNKMAKMYKGIDAKLKEYGGDMPYGMRRATPKEQREQYETLTPEKLMELTQMYGEAEVNNWLRKNMQEGQ